MTFKKCTYRISFFSFFLQIFVLRDMEKDEPPEKEHFVDTEEKQVNINVNNSGCMDNNARMRHILNAGLVYGYGHFHPALTNNTRSIFNLNVYL